MTAAERLLAAVRGTIGVRFRAQGRDPALGLDCVGMVAVGLAAAGCAVDLPRHYALRRGTVPDLPDLNGLAACDGAAAGDILLCRVSPAQLHLAVRSEDGVIHADAALRRVIARPGPVPWPIERAWRALGRLED